MAPTGSSSGWAGRARPRDLDAPLAALAAAGHPVIDIPLTDGTWVGAEFVRWEVATAIAGAVLGVDPFDEPNVTESKQNTRAALEQHAHHGCVPGGAGDRHERAAPAVSPTPLLAAELGARARIQRRGRAPGPPRAYRRAGLPRHQRVPRGDTRADRRRCGGSRRSCATAPGTPRPLATARGSCTPPGSCTRAARRRVASCSWSRATRTTCPSPAARRRSGCSSTRRHWATWSHSRRTACRRSASTSRTHPTPGSRSSRTLLAHALA